MQEYADVESSTKKPVVVARRHHHGRTVKEAIDRLDQWITNTGWVGYDPFDGLSAPFARRLTFEVPFLRIVLEQSVRRLPVNLRPLLGITKQHSTKPWGTLQVAICVFTN